MASERLFPECRECGAPLDPTERYRNCEDCRAAYSDGKRTGCAKKSDRLTPAVQAARTPLLDYYDPVHVWQCTKPQRAYK